MLGTFTRIALALSLLAGPLAAQTSDTEDATASEAPSEAAPADPAETLSIEQFGDWELRCETTTNNCFMYQLARDGNLNPVAELSLVALPEGGEVALGITVITPLGTMLNEGIVLQIDSGVGRQYPFNWCTRSGCFARFGATAEEVAAMKAGVTARLRILSISAPDEPVILEVSLRGFTAAHNALTTR